MKTRNTVIGLAVVLAIIALLLFVPIQGIEIEALELPDGYRVQCALDEPVYSMWVPFEHGDGGFYDPNVYPSERDAILSAIRYEEFRRTPREKERDKYQWKDCKGKEAP